MGGASSTEGSGGGGGGGKDVASHHHHHHHHHQQQQQQQQQGAEQSPTSESDIYPLVIKKEPEDLTRRNIRHGGQHHSESRGLLCSNNEVDKVDGASSGGTVISRVLADGELVHEIIPRLESISHVNIGSGSGSGTSGGSGSDNREAMNSSGSVIHIRRSLSSQQQQQQQQGNDQGQQGTGGDSMAGISSGALDLARAGMQSNIQQQYSSSSYNNGSVVVGGGLTTIHAVSSHHGYDSSPGATYSTVVSPNDPGSAYTTINSSPSLRHQQAGSYSTATAVGSADPFYRDYFNNSSNNNNANTNTNTNSNATSGANSEQQYSRAVAQLAYAGGEVHEGAFVDRFIRSHTVTGVYKQQSQQGGTGLTVDLPSPDSGIGVDAVTPREQSVAQQVS